MQNWASARKQKSPHPALRTAVASAHKHWLPGKGGFAADTAHHRRGGAPIACAVFVCQNERGAARQILRHRNIQRKGPVSLPRRRGRLLLLCGAIRRGGKPGIVGRRIRGLFGDVEKRRLFPGRGGLFF